jgi:HEAT repeat protein
LSDSDSSVRKAALDGLTFQVSDRRRAWLHNEIQSPDVVTRVYAARALQITEGAKQADVFRNYLNEHADAMNDYATLVQAIVGPRDSYLTEPVPVTLEALRDSRRDIRLAATLAFG